MTINPELQPETLSWGTIVFAIVVSAIVLAGAHRARRMCNKPIRYSVRAAAIGAAIALLFYAFTTRETRCELWNDAHRTWRLWRDPNVIAYREKYETHESGIRLFALPDGVVVTDYNASDLVFTLNAAGRVSVHDRSLRKDVVRALLGGWRERRGAFRTFVRIDRDAPIAARTDLLNVLAEFDCFPLYVVGTGARGEKPEYVAEILRSGEDVKMWEAGMRERD